MSRIWSGMVTPSPSGPSISWPQLNGDENNNENENNNMKMNFQFKDLPPQVKTGFRSRKTGFNSLKYDKLG